jgi:putative membrane protein
MAHSRSRLSEALLPGGEEPDPRFTLANERTFLAWIRTALAFIAGGIALEAFAGTAIADPWRTVLSLFIVIIGLLLSLGALLAPLLGLGGAIAAAVVVAVIVTQ